MTSTQEGWGLPQHMKALRAHRRGGPEQLVYEDAPVPAPAAGDDVCVKVHVAAITFDELTWPDTWRRTARTAPRSSRRTSSPEWPSRSDPT